ncbi:hypothetical protein KSW81_001518 [Nannochloris sp. 'desiccata']|nr:hypothetical protein KSW81_001518 [Chlorella desiccata (nom. nud.)]
MIHIPGFSYSFSSTLGGGYRNPFFGFFEMRKLACIVFIFAVNFCPLTSAKSVLDGKVDTNPVIAYGNDASRDQFPWMASIIIPTQVGPWHYCGGTLINALYILTAAHCIVDTSGNVFPGPWTVKVGCLNWRTDGVSQCDVRQAAAYKVHPNYKYYMEVPLEGYDIALIRLNFPSEMPLMPLASGYPAIGTTVTAAGWGLTEIQQGAEVLKWVNLRVTDINSAGFQIKTGPDRGKTCSGDSGGPIWSSAGQVGITSWGPVDCGGYTFSWYTNIGSFRSWISETITEMNPDPPIPNISDGLDKILSLVNRRVSYEVCSCNAPNVFGGKNVVGSKGQLWKFIATEIQTTPQRYYIKAASMSTCPSNEAEYLWLTAPECPSYDECGTSQGPYLAPSGVRQEWILEEASGGFKIRSAYRFDSRYSESYIGMSGDEAASLFFTSSVSSYAYAFTISTNSDSIFYSCASPQIPSPTPSPIPSPQPSPSPSADPTPQAEPSLSPPRNRSPPRARRPPPRRSSPRRPPPRSKTPLRSPPLRKSPPRRPPPRRPPPRSPLPLPSTPLPSPPPAIVSQWLSPGIDFMLIIPGYTTATFDTVQESALFGSIIDGWTPTAAFKVMSVKPFSSTPSSVLVSGYAYFAFSATPTVIQLQTAATQRDARIAALTTNTGSVLGGFFPAAVPYCNCNGFNIVTTSITASYTYETIDNGVPGPMQCGAKLTYDNNDANAIISQVGIDDGSLTPSNLGKYCSTPAVNGGVIGFPGFGSCRQYGVIGDGTIGKLCSPAPIPSLPASIASDVPTAITFGGPCRPLGRNTYLNQVCSTPGAPGGVFELINTGNCNVQSSFIAQPGSTMTNPCGILPQSFVITAAPS